MTNQNAIVPTSYNLANVSESAIKKLTNQLIGSLTGSQGRPLSPLHAAQIALITLTTDLSPFLGEVYATDKGIMIGVLAYERKAQEYLDAFLPGTNYHITYREAIPDKDGDFDGARDVAYVARLTRDDWDRQWQEKLQNLLRTLKEADITGKEAYEIAINQIGEKPYAEAVGVVDGRESFSGVYDRGEYAGQDRPEMFDRHERAKKRARKNVLKHEFPRMSIPDPMKILAEDHATRLIEVAQREAPRQAVVIPAGMTSEDLENQLLKETGFNGQDKKQQGTPVIIETDAGQFPKDGTHRFDLDIDYQDSDFDPSELDDPFDEETDALEVTAVDPAVWSTAVENTIKARVGFTDPKKLLEAFMASQFLAPTYKQEYLNKWASFYIQKRGKGENPKEQAVAYADNSLANLMSAKN